MTIGEKIKQRRLELGLGQRELAKRVGYKDNSTIAKIESGKIDLPLSKVDIFAEALRTTHAYLMGWEDEDQKNNPTLEGGGLSDNRKKLMRFVEEVPEDKVELLWRVMRSILEGD